MYIKTPEEFLSRFKVFEPQDHHYTGPLPNQQPECNGSVFHHEGRILATLAYNLGGDVLETGADQGISTRYIHEGLEAWNNRPGATLASHIWSVDVLHKWGGADYPGIDPDWPLRYKINGDSGSFNLPGGGPYRWLQEDKSQGPFISCKWAFIDGDHRYRGVIRDIGAALRSGCTRMIFHDTADHIRKNPDNPTGGSDARDAVPEFFAGLPGWHLFDISTHCGMIYATCVDRE
jgi:hypothetical protein